MADVRPAPYGFGQRVERPSGGWTDASKYAVGTVAKALRYKENGAGTSLQPMQQQTAVVCEGCGNSYAAREVDRELVVSTDDGRCSCGNDSFVRVETAIQSLGGAPG